MTKEKFYAHVREISPGHWNEHYLSKHLNDTGELAGSFAEIFNNKDWAELSGFWHDLGKYLPDWQAYLSRKSGYGKYDPEAHIETGKGRPNHSTAGAVLSFQRFSDMINNPERARSIARILGYIISGHHAGLPDNEPPCIGDSLMNRVYKVDTNGLNTSEIDQVKTINEALVFCDKNLPATSPFEKLDVMNHKEHFHLWIRMLFSCLVDADYLDTELFMKPEQAELRSKYPELAGLSKRFSSFMEKKQNTADNTPINEERKKILKACQDKAINKSGFFSLNVPTGGGKTLSSMAFALKHALYNGQKRIIMAIPYTSIIEQTSKVYKYGTDDDNEIEKIIKNKEWLFGEEAVIEHHSNIDPEKITSKSSLATENWDAPVIVTTNVQLFESLLASKPSDCRKLHNIANSVIILDEAQMLPPEYLKPILSVLKGLVEHFKVTVVLCTATQPALEGNIGSQGTFFKGIDNIIPIIDKPKEYAGSFKRVNISAPANLNVTTSWPEIAEELHEYEQVLCIVNRRDDCRKLHSLMPKGTIHLSGLMCGEERSEIISAIKSDLKENKPIRVISTQLVEAGVDIDFPIVYRAIAGIDSIAQAAGRCNREGILNAKGRLGNVIVFNPPKPSPSGLLRKGEDVSKEILRMNNSIELTPDLFYEYFAKFYASVNDFDKAKFKARLLDEANEFKFQFRTFAADFKLIDNKAQAGIIVWYKSEKYDSRVLIDELIRKGPSPKLLRKLQRFTVNVPMNEFRKLEEKGVISCTETHEYFVQSMENLYIPGLGLMYDAEWDSTSFVQ